VLRVRAEAITVERHVWHADGGAFALNQTEQFSRVKGRWIET